MVTKERMVRHSHLGVGRVASNVGGGCKGDRPGLARQLLVPPPPLPPVTVPAARICAGTGKAGIRVARCSPRCAAFS